MHTLFIELLKLIIITITLMVKLTIKIITITIKALIKANTAISKATNTAKEKANDPSARERVTTTFTSTKEKVYTNPKVKDFFTQAKATAEQAKDKAEQAYTKAKANNNRTTKVHNQYTGTTLMVPADDEIADGEII